MTFLHYLPDFSSRAAYCGAALEDGILVTPQIWDADCPDCRKPQDEASYWIGYSAAKAQLLRLVGKVEEKSQIGVILAWLWEGNEDAEEAPGVHYVRTAGPAPDADLRKRPGSPA